MGLVEEPPGEIINESKDLVCLAFAAGGHLALLRLVQNLGPPGLTPLEAFRLAQMIRDKAGFLIRKAHILEQRRDIMGMVDHAKVALNEVLNHRRIPASRGIA